MFRPVLSAATQAPHPASPAHVVQSRFPPRLTNPSKPKPLQLPGHKPGVRTGSRSDTPSVSRAASASRLSQLQNCLLGPDLALPDPETKNPRMLSLRLEVAHS